ncbi:MAG: hypothetical protein HOP10_07395 [Chitinophagaceae bacterium]|nr:hypothetical protein [Chitinophagaceae bacterium]
MHFHKEDLSCTHYYPYDAKQLFTGQPTRRLFDRFNGSQVLFLINFYGSLADRFTLKEGQAIEKQIATLLPVEAKSEISVFNWIRNSATSSIPSIF